MKQFRIKQYEYFDEDGNLDNKYYFIQKRISLLGVHLWRCIKEKRCGWGDCEMVVKRFKTVQEAEVFIKDVLCVGKPHNQHKTTIVEVVNCQTFKNKEK